MKRLYLYLASRSKMAGIKLVTVLQSETTAMSPVTDLKTLKLPQIWEKKIAQIIHENRMLYEPWVQTATNYEELRNNLISRGYREVPVSSSLMLEMKAYVQAPHADTSSCTTRKTMLRKRS